MKDIQGQMRHAQDVDHGQYLRAGHSRNLGVGRSIDCSRQQQFNREVEYFGIRGRGK